MISKHFVLNEDRRYHIRIVVRSGFWSWRRKTECDINMFDELDELLDESSHPITYKGRSKRNDFDNDEDEYDNDDHGELF
jgi:hypothetical protein